MQTRLFTENRLIVATHNQGKLREIRALLANQEIEVLSAGDLGLDEPEETENSFIGNARLKARAASGASGFVALADDSGLVVDALGGAPGIYSARWAGPDKDFSVAMQKVETKLSRWKHRTDGPISSVRSRLSGPMISTSRLKAALMDSLSGHRVAIGGWLRSNFRS